MSRNDSTGNGASISVSASTLTVSSDEEAPLKGKALTEGMKLHFKRTSIPSQRSKPSGIGSGSAATAARADARNGSSADDTINTESLGDNNETTLSSDEEEPLKGKALNEGVKQFFGRTSLPNKRKDSDRTITSSIGSTENAPETTLSSDDDEPLRGKELTKGVKKFFKRTSLPPQQSMRPSAGTTPHRRSTKIQRQASSAGITSPVITRNESVSKPPVTVISQKRGRSSQLHLASDSSDIGDSYKGIAAARESNTDESRRQELDDTVPTQSKSHYSKKSSTSRRKIRSIEMKIQGKRGRRLSNPLESSSRKRARHIVSSSESSDADEQQQSVATEKNLEPADAPKIPASNIEFRRSGSTSSHESLPSSGGRKLHNITKQKRSRVLSASDASETESSDTRITKKPRSARSRSPAAVGSQSPAQAQGLRSNRTFSPQKVTSPRIETKEKTPQRHSATKHHQKLAHDVLMGSDTSDADGTKKEVAHKTNSVQDSSRNREPQEVRQPSDIVSNSSSVRVTRSPLSNRTSSLRNFVSPRETHIAKDLPLIPSLSMTRQKRSNNDSDTSGLSDSREESTERFQSTPIIPGKRREDLTFTPIPRAHPLPIDQRTVAANDHKRIPARQIEKPIEKDKPSKSKVVLPKILKLRQSDVVSSQKPSDDEDAEPATPPPPRRSRQESISQSQLTKSKSHVDVSQVYGRLMENFNPASHASESGSTERTAASYPPHRSSSVSTIVTDSSRKGSAKQKSLQSTVLPIPEHIPRENNENRIISPRKEKSSASASGSFLKEWDGTRRSKHNERRSSVSAAAQESISRDSVGKISTHHERNSALRSASTRRVSTEKDQTREQSTTARSLPQASAQKSTSGEPVDKRSTHREKSSVSARSASARPTEEEDEANTPEQNERAHSLSPASARDSVSRKQVEKRSTSARGSLPRNQDKNGRFSTRKSKLTASFREPISEDQDEKESSPPGKSRSSVVTTRGSIHKSQDERISVSNRTTRSSVSQESVLEDQDESEGSSPRRTRTASTASAPADKTPTVVSPSRRPSPSTRPVAAKNPERRGRGSVKPSASKTKRLQSAKPAKPRRKISKSDRESILLGNSGMIQKRFIREFFLFSNKKLAPGDLNRMHVQYNDYAQQFFDRLTEQPNRPFGVFSRRDLEEALRVEGLIGDGPQDFNISLMTIFPKEQYDRVKQFLVDDDDDDDS